MGKCASRATISSDIHDRFRLNGIRHLTAAAVANEQHIHCALFYVVLWWHVCHRNGSSFEHVVEWNYDWKIAPLIRSNRIVSFSFFHVLSLSNSFDFFCLPFYFKIFIQFSCFGRIAHCLYSASFEVRMKANLFGYVQWNTLHSYRSRCYWVTRSDAYLLPTSKIHGQH